MSFPPVGSQSLYLYPFKWDSAKDKFPLDCLIEKIEECNPSPPHLSPHALIHAMLKLNSQLQADMSLNEVEGRVEFLHERYVCFKYLCKVEGTQWDQQNNVIHVTDEVCKELFKENAFFRAYYNKGDPAFIQMCNLFGIHDVKKELSHTVISIEDSSTIKKQCESSDDEVTSPIPKPVASRKLFADDACSSVSASIPNPFKSKVVVSWKSLKNKFQWPNGIPVKPKDDRRHDAGCGASSCASSSPFK